MQIQKISQLSRENSVTFCANLLLTGHINDIEEKTVQMWKNRVKDIGTNKDLITLHFGTFMKERGHNFENGKNADWFASIRAIYASVQMNGKKLIKNQYIGYRIMNQPHSTELRDKNVSEFLDNFC